MEAEREWSVGRGLSKCYLFVFVDGQRERRTFERKRENSSTILIR